MTMSDVRERIAELEAEVRSARKSDLVTFFWAGAKWRAERDDEEFQRAVAGEDVPGDGPVRGLARAKARAERRVAELERFTDAITDLWSRSGPMKIEEYTGRMEHLMTSVPDVTCEYGERVTELEAKVAELEAERDAWIVQADGAGKGVVALEAEVEHLRAYAGRQDELIHSLRVRAEASEAEVARLNDALDAAHVRHGMATDWGARLQAKLAEVQSALDSDELDGPDHDESVYLDEANRILDAVRAVLDEGNET